MSFNGTGIRLVFFSIGLVFMHQANAQFLLKKDTVYKLLSESPAFTIFKDNYFITGIPLNESPDQYNSDVKYQISFKQRLTNQPLFSIIYPYLSYTQKSFWDIYQNSSPFAESNYNPALNFITPLFKNGLMNSSVSLSIEHESNGLSDQKSDSGSSRSWNYVAVGYSRILTSKCFGYIKMWVPFSLSGNPDLMDYVGYGEASLSYIILKDKLISNVLIRKGATWDWKGSFMLDIQYKPFKRGNQYLMVQWWNGYSESLIEYNRYTNMLRFGIAFRPTYYRFF